MRKATLIVSMLLTFQSIFAQTGTEDSTKKTAWTNHFQLTAIGQKHSGFRSLYKGENSLADSVEPAATSLTATLFLGRKLWKGAALYFNPEVSGGKGLSFATGVAGALNGETYRVGDVAPQVFVARAYLQQHFPLGGTVYEEVNQVPESLPASRITITAGKFAVADFYDNNSYSKDPRTQFFNWSVWANGAWDYPADTRGYTTGIVAELITPAWSVRLSTVAVPRIANFHLMEYNSKAHSETLELEHRVSIHKRSGSVRAIVSHTSSQAPSYADGLKALLSNNRFLPDVIQGAEEHKAYGGHKTGAGINVEQQISNDAGFFSRIGWNDGRYATWAFTEIDQTINAGFSIKGTKWGRTADVLAMAGAINGLSKGHRDFLKAGGTGFIIGDGTLTYGHEAILDTYYKARVNPFLWLTFDYQLVSHPGYNKDRGPVHVFGIRGHVEL